MGEMTMVDRVAGAIAGQIDEATFYKAPAFQNAACAAIEAMREPTGMMIAEMESAASIGMGRPYDDKAIPRLWNCAINAALEEK